MPVATLKQAASLVSGFDFRKCSYFCVSCYLIRPDGRLTCFGVNIYDNLDADEWGKKKWYNELKKLIWWNGSVDVVSFEIYFCFENNRFTLEATGQSNDFRFDRLLFMNDGSLCEAFLTARESAQMRSVSDVIKIEKKVASPLRSNPIGSDRALCLSSEDYDDDLEEFEELEY